MSRLRNRLRRTGWVSINDWWIWKEFRGLPPQRLSPFFERHQELVPLATVELEHDNVTTAESMVLSNHLQRGCELEDEMKEAKKEFDAVSRDLAGGGAEEGEVAGGGGG